MADDRIEIEILLDDGSVKKGFANVKKQGEKTASSLSTSFGGLGKRFLAIGASIAAVVGAGIFTRQSIAAAQEQEDAINQLNTSLRTAGTFSEQASRELQEFAASLQQTSTIGDEVILTQLALARNFTNTNEEARRLTEAAVDLSAATGLTLDSAVRNLGKTFAGLTGELGESVPALRSLTAEQLKAGEAITLISERFGGAASAQLQTFSGRTEQLGNVFGDLQEAIGSFVTQSPALTALFGVIVEGLTDAINSITNFQKGTGDIFVPIINGALALGIALNTAIIGPLEAVSNAVNLSFQGIRTAVQGALFFVTDSIANFVNVIAPNSDFAQRVNEFNATIGATFQSFANQSGQALDGLFGFERTEQINQWVENLQTRISELNVGGFQPLANNIEQAGKKIDKEAKKAEFNVKQALGAGISRTIQSTVQALLEGENAFSGFAKATLSVFGDLAIQLGQFFIINGLAIEALIALGGAAAIAAGAALVALGTILKSASGGAPGLSNAAGVPGGDAGQVGGGFVDEVDEVEDTEQRDETRVAINIQGDVFDSQETGLRLVDILNESFDSNGTRLVTA